MSAAVWYRIASAVLWARYGLDPDDVGLDIAHAADGVTPTEWVERIARKYHLCEVPR